MKLVVTHPSRYMLRQLIRLFRRYDIGDSLDAGGLLPKSGALPDAAVNATADEKKGRNMDSTANVEPRSDADMRVAADGSTQNEPLSDWVVTSAEEATVALSFVSVENRENCQKPFIASTKWGIRRNVSPSGHFDRHNSAHLANSGLQNSTACPNLPQSHGTLR